MALFPTNHTLTQGSLHYRLATLGYQKLNTDGVDSPCKRLPGVGSFLANPGLSKEQLVPSCEVRVFIVADTFIEILTYFAIYLFVYQH